MRLILAILAASVLAGGEEQVKPVCADKFTEYRNGFRVGEAEGLRIAADTLAFAANRHDVDRRAKPVLIMLRLVLLEEAGNRLDDDAKAKIGGAK